MWYLTPGFKNVKVPFEVCFLMVYL